MKVIVVIIDGAQSVDYKELNFSKIAQEQGLVNNTPDGMDTDSLICIMNILGVSKKDIPTGRAYLEALAADCEVSDNDIIFRYNGVSIENNILLSSCKYRNTPYLNDNIKLIPLGGYKNLLILKNGKEYYNSIVTYPPHNNIGENIEKILPKTDNPELQKFLQELITKHQLWSWGQAVKTDFPTFYELHQTKGAVVCKTEIVKGIAKAMDMHCPNTENSTAEIDTDLREKAKVALKLSEEYDFTILHINGADEAAHRKDSAQKHEFIKKIDHEVISYILKNLPKETALIITSDHATDAKTGKHKNEAVDYYIFNKNKECEQWLKR